MIAYDSKNEDIYQNQYLQAQVNGYGQFRGSDVDFKEAVNQGQHYRQMSTHSKSSAITYRHFSLQPPSFESTEKCRESAGAEPGIDYRTTFVELENAIGSEITWADYSSDRIKISQLDVPVTDGSANANVTALLEARPKWSRVRWINVNGLTSEAIAPITKFYKIHPLVVEDMLDIPQRTKIDVSSDRMFACFPLHTLRHLKSKESFTHRTLGFISQAFQRGKDQDIVEEPVQRLAGLSQVYQSSSDLSIKISKLPGRMLSLWDQNDKGRIDHELLKVVPKEYREKMVEVEQVSIYLTEDTVITFFEQAAPSVLEPLMTRMMCSQSILRLTEDSGMLAQAIIDTCVDLIAPIIREYAGRIRRLHLEAIQCPTLSHTRALNILLSDLTVLRSSVTSMSGMINGFRSRLRQESADGNFRPSCLQLSETAVLYFGDVADHVLSYVTDLSIMHEKTKQMTTLIFNTISIKSSDAVRLLSLVTVVFLPLSFLTGYFGMNFTDFDTLNNNVDYYWCIAGPFTASLAFLLTYPWIFEKLKNTWRTTYRSF